MNTAKTLLTEGDFRKKLIYFAIPLFVGNLFQQMYNTADSLIVGNFLGPQALAAVSGVGSLIYLFTGFFLGFSTGAGVVIARYIGSENPEQTQKAVHTTVALGLVLSLIMTVVGVLGTPYFLKWMGTSEDVIPLSNMYLKIYFSGITGLVMYNIFTGILQASGDAKHPLIYLVVSSMINIVLDVLFIVIFGMSVDGAALATILSEILTALLVMIRLLQTQESVKLSISKIRFDRKNLKRIFDFGFPTALQGCVIDISNILIQSYINSFGSLAMAGIGASSKSEGFIFLPITAFSMAMTTYISQNMGAGKYDRVKDGIRFGLMVALTLIETLGMIYFCFAPQIIGFFTSDPEVVIYGMQKARVVAFFFLFVGYSHITSAILRGLGKPMVPMVVMLVCWCAVRVVVLFTLGQVVHNIWICYWIYPITWVLSSVVFYFYLKNVLRKELV